MKKVITVDGPAGSGKEKISRYIARKYNLYHLDSGILYRRLAYELSKKNTGNTLYILDEPTTGLHFHDIAILLKTLIKLRDSGNSILVIEHNLDVIKTADWIIDMGPEGGNKGGEIISEGPPEEIAKDNASKTGFYLKKLLF